MIEVAYGIAGFCLLVAAYQIGHRRALRKVKVDNQTDYTIDIHVIPADNAIIIKKITEKK